MGLEGVGFLWYTKKISLWALLGFGLALGTYQLLGGIYNSGWAPPGTAEMR